LRKLSPARKRLRAFGFHLIGYFAAMVLLVPLNLGLMPGDPWFLLPLLGWGSVLALHAAHVMGLFDPFRKG
jgi:hypothetical protein